MPDTGYEFNFWMQKETAEIYCENIPPYGDLVVEWLTQFYDRLNFNEYMLFYNHLPYAIDLACGDGRLGHVLSRRSEEVIGIDISKSMVFHGQQKYGGSNLIFHHGSHRDLPIFCGYDKPGLIVVGMGINFFNTPSFFKMVRSCLKPKGVFAAFGWYMKGDIEDGPSLGHLLYPKLEECLTGLLPMQQSLKQCYRDIVLPFDIVERHHETLVYEMSLDQVLGLLEGLYCDRPRGPNIPPEFIESLPKEEKFKMQFDVFGVMGSDLNPDESN